MMYALHKGIKINIKVSSIPILKFIDRRSIKIFKYVDTKYTDIEIN